ncbi:MAG: hypothetical protein ACI95K_001120, partial [Lentimonas sp.]
QIFIFSIATFYPFSFLLYQLIPTPMTPFATPNYIGVYL